MEFSFHSVTEQPVSTKIRSQVNVEIYQDHSSLLSFIETSQFISLCIIIGKSFSNSLDLFVHLRNRAENLIDSSVVLREKMKKNSLRNCMLAQYLCNVNELFFNRFPSIAIDAIQMNGICSSLVRLCKKSHFFSNIPRLSI